MHFEKDLSKKALQKDWTNIVQAHCEPHCRTIRGNLDALNRLTVDIKSGDRLELVFFPNRTCIDLNGKRIGVVKGPLFSSILQSYWNKSATTALP